jgi:hypothetical protein
MIGGYFHGYLMITAILGIRCGPWARRAFHWYGYVPAHSSSAPTSHRSVFHGYRAHRDTHETAIDVTPARVEHGFTRITSREATAIDTHRPRPGTGAYPRDAAAQRGRHPAPIMGNGG